MKYLFQTFAYIFFVLANQLLFAQNLKIERSNIANNNGIFLLKSVIAVVPDSLQNLDIDKVSSPDFQKNFDKSAYYDWTESKIEKHWLRFTIENEDVEKLWLLHLHASEIKLYSPDSTAFNMVQSGYLLPVSERIYGANFGQCIYLPLRINKNQVKTFFCSISIKDFPVFIPETVAEPELILYQTVSADSRQRFLPQALYLNVALTFTLVCALMYWLRKRKKYLYFLLHLASVCLLLAYLKGFSLEFLFFANPYFNYHGFVQFAFWFYGFSLLLLVKKLFDLASWDKKMELFFNIGLVSSPLFYIFPIGSISFLSVAGTHLLVEILLLCSVGFYFFSVKKPLYKVYMTAFLFLFLSILINLYFRNIDMEIPYFNLEDVMLVALPMMLFFAQMRHEKQIETKKNKQQNRLILNLQEYKTINEQQVEFLEKTNLLKNEEVKTLSQQLEKNRLELAKRQENEEMQSDLIRLQTQNINLSIEYIKKIQNIVFLNVEKNRAFLPAHFVFLKPKQLISSDFYWFHEKNNFLVLVVADCIGYGTLGALMGMIGELLLKEIVIDKEIRKSNLILEELNQKIRQIFLENGNKIVYEGLGISVCVIDKKNKILTYSGAINPLYYAQKNELIEIKAHRYPVGGMQRGADFTFFESHQIDISEPTMVYLCTDGYQDQFGGEKTRKFMLRNFKALLQSIHHLPLEQQEKALEKIMTAWMGKCKQMDDMLVFGLRFLAESWEQ